MEYPERHFENRENVGRDIEVVIHFMRHGPKDEEGKLTEAGAAAAQETGEKMSDRETMKLYISDRARVRDTAEAIIRGAQLTKTMKTRVRSRAYS